MTTLDFHCEYTGGTRCAVQCSACASYSTQHASSSAATQYTAQQLDAMRVQAHDYTMHWLGPLCLELVAWMEVGILAKDAEHYRTLKELCRYAGHIAGAVAEAMVHEHAMKACIQVDKDKQESAVNMFARKARL